MATQATNSSVKRTQREQAYIQEQNVNTFTPQITDKAKKIGRTLDDLIADTQARMINKNKAKVEVQAEVQQISSSSDKVIHDRFDKQFNEAAADLGICGSVHEAEADISSVQVDCPKMSLLFLKLGFVSPVAKESEQVMLAEIWKRVGGDTQGTNSVPLINVKNFMRAIQNFHHQDMMDTTRSGPEVDTSNLGRHSDSGLLFTPSEIEFVTRLYRDLFANRQNKLAEIKKNIHQERSKQKKKLEEEYKYKPTLRGQTTDLANKKRMEESQLPAQIHERLAQEIVTLAQRRNSLQKKHEEDEAKKMPFKPQISIRKNASP